MPIQMFPRPRDTPVVRQLRFLIALVRAIPRLVAALEAGHVETSLKLGGRTLRDGRRAELWLVARAPRRETGPLVRGGAGPRR